MESLNKSSYVQVRLLAQAILLFVLERGYHFFHYLGYQMKWIWFGYVIGPLVYTVLVLLVIRAHNQWLENHGIERLRAQGETWIDYAIYGGIGILLAMACRYVWSMYWRGSFDPFYWTIYANYLSWDYFDGQPLGVFKLITFYSVYATKAFIAIQIGYVFYLLREKISPWQGRLAMALVCLVTFGLSETMYYGVRSGAFTLLSTAVGLILVQGNPRRWPILWGFILLAFMI